MGTMALILDRDPTKGGRAIGWFGMDGHPNSLATLSQARTRKSFLIRLKSLARRRGRSWIPTAPGCWAFWASYGYLVMDFTYWFDEERGRTMVASYRSAPVELTPEVAVNSSGWPDSAEVHPPHVDVLLPEIHVSANPDRGLPLHRWTAASELNGEVDAARLLEGSADVEIVRSGRTRGLWCPEGWAGMFEIRDSAGKLLGSGRRLAAACGDASRRVVGKLGPENPDQISHYKLFSVEALLEEFPIGDVSVRRERDGYAVRIEHALAGTVRGRSDRLHEAVLAVRRELHATPGITLDAPRMDAALRLTRH